MYRTLCASIALGLFAGLIGEVVTFFSPQATVVLFAFICGAGCFWCMHSRDNCLISDRELNHNIRNAVQVLAYSNDQSRKDASLRRVVETLQHYSAHHRIWDRRKNRIS